MVSLLSKDCVVPRNLSGEGNGVPWTVVFKLVQKYLDKFIWCILVTTQLSLNVENQKEFMLVKWKVIYLMVMVFVLFLDKVKDFQFLEVIGLKVILCMVNIYLKVFYLKETILVQESQYRIQIKFS